jgi:hypothetical protein
MQTPPLVLEARATVYEAARMLREGTRECIVILTEGRPVGIVTEPDLHPRRRAPGTRCCRRTSCGGAATGRGGPTRSVRSGPGAGRSTEHEHEHETDGRARTGCRRAPSSWWACWVAPCDALRVDLAGRRAGRPRSGCGDRRRSRGSRHHGAGERPRGWPRSRRGRAALVVGAMGSSGISRQLWAKPRTWPISWVRAFWRSRPRGRRPGLHTRSDQVWLTAFTSMSDSGSGRSSLDLIGGERQDLGACSRARPAPRDRGTTRASEHHPVDPVPLHRGGRLGEALDGEGHRGARELGWLQGAAAPATAWTSSSEVSPGPG